ncbi:MAG: hypothetical protein ABIK37_00870 [candidate division WOR-3 bacterium]
MLRAAVLILAVAALALAETPRFDGPYPILDGGVPIDVGYYGSPVMFDWDGDGAKDLICGQFTSGMIRYYRNLGPDSAPLFNGYEFMRASGSTIILPSG